uniref:Uncharacterized protein n=1 Tax=Mola mola TaxID=94237 RepID=A0A3Q3XRN2_MOLML
NKKNRLLLIYVLAYGATEKEQEQQPMVIFIVRQEGDSDSSPSKIGIVVDGVKVLDDLPSFASACAVGFNIWPQLVPQATEYTFEFFHKVLLKHEKYQGLKEELERKNSMMNQDEAR